MDRSEVVQLIQDYCCGKIKMSQKNFNDGKYIVLGKYCVPHDVLTPLKVYGKDNEYYTVESLIHLWHNKDDTHMNYVKKAAATGIKPVTRIDKREMIEYLSGKTSTLPSFYDPAWIPVLPVPVSRLGQPGEPAAKKIKMEVMDEYCFSQPDVPLQLKIKQEVTKNGSQQWEVSEEPREEIRALSDVLTSEKILQLKRKKQLNQKMKKIANVGRDIFDQFGDSYIPKRTDFEVVTYADRETIMQSGKLEFTNIFVLLNEIQITDRKIRIGNEPKMEAPQRTPAPPKMPRYDRYDQEAFVKEDVSAFQSFVGQDFKNLGAVMSAAEEKSDMPELSPIFPSEPVARKPVSEPIPRPLPKKVLPVRRKINGLPIIVIPAAGNMSGTLINMYNAADILESMRFVEPTQRKAEGAKNETQILIRRQFNGRNVSYRVIENPLRLGSDEWDRVVAVFVMGPLWQFKGWKWNGNPTEIFSNIPAFHLYYEDLSLDKNVARLNVTPIPISRHKRHLDRSRLIKFWEIVDRHIMKTYFYRRHQ